MRKRSVTVLDGMCGLGVLMCLALCSEVVADTADIYDYHYGDEEFDYDTHVTKKLEAGNRIGGKNVEEFIRDNDPIIPLCCPEGYVYQLSKNCSLPAAGWDWKPTLSGEPMANFRFKGFPKCIHGNPVSVYQKEVLFDDGDAFVPHYIQLDPVPSSKYCITKVYDDQEPEVCVDHQTKVYVCVEESLTDPGLYWLVVGVSHLMLVLTLLAFFCVRDLRCLQSQYMICFVISLLLYNICLLPLSVLTLDINFVSCVSLGAVKYFFFCGVILWFNIICFDIWRTLKNRQDVGSRKRFLLYSVYTWIVGAALTTVVLVLPYAWGQNRDDSLMESTTTMCKLRTDINMILQLVELFLMIINLIFLSLASSHICKYNKFGKGLLRPDAIFCLKQGWKLFAIMVCHLLIDVPDDILKIEFIDLWRYVFLESLAIFAVFAYRKTVIKSIQKFICHSNCYHPEDEESSVHEKDQLTSVR